MFSDNTKSVIKMRCENDVSHDTFFNVKFPMIKGKVVNSKTSYFEHNTIFANRQFSYIKIPIGGTPKPTTVTVIIEPKGIPVLGVQFDPSKRHQVTLMDDLVTL